MGGCEDALRPIKIAYYHLSICLVKSICSCAIYPHLHKAIYMSYLHVKLLVMTQPDGYSDLLLSQA